MRSNRPSRSVFKCRAASGESLIFIVASCQLPVAGCRCPLATGNWQLATSFRSVHDARLRILALEPIRIELDQFQLALQLDHVRAFSRREVDQQIAVDGRRAAAELGELLLHRPLARDEELRGLAIRQVAFQDVLEGQSAGERERVPELDRRLEHSTNRPCFHQARPPQFRLHTPVRSSFSKYMRKSQVPRPEKDSNARRTRRQIAPYAALSLV